MVRHSCREGPWDKGTAVVTGHGGSTPVGGVTLEHVVLAEGEGWLSQQEAALVHRVLTDTGKRQHVKTSIPSHSLQSLGAAEST